MPFENCSSDYDFVSLSVTLFLFTPAPRVQSRGSLSGGGAPSEAALGGTGKIL